MMRRRDLRTRLGRTLLLQVSFISLAAVLGVVLAKALIEDVLIRQALLDEAAYFWDKRATNPLFPLPDTRNLTAYLDEPPESMAALPPGFHNLQATDERGLVLVTERAAQRLYLEFDGERVDELAFYFGLLPLSVVLLVIYLSTWLGFRASKRAVSPVIALAREVRALDLESPDPAVFDPGRLADEPDEEVSALADALYRFAQRLNEFVDRERNFTRDASHELRSPLTVINMASALLAEKPELTASSRRALDRIRRAVRDMEELISTFLLLAREQDAGLPNEALCINEVAAAELRRAGVLAGDKPIEAELTEQCRLFIEAPEKVLSVMIGNLLRNAYSYTDEGKVSITIAPGRVIIEDSGIGMNEDQLARLYRPFEQADQGRRGGYGVGLTIVRRLSDRFGWPLDIKSEVGVGTRVEIGFPDATEAAPSSA